MCVHVFHCGVVFLEALCVRVLVCVLVCLCVYVLVCACMGVSIIYLICVHTCIYFCDEQVIGNAHKHSHSHTKRLHYHATVAS